MGKRNRHEHEHRNTFSLDSLSSLVAGAMPAEAAPAADSAPLESDIDDGDRPTQPPECPPGHDSWVNESDEPVRFRIFVGPGFWLRVHANAKGSVVHIPSEYTPAVPGLAPHLRRL